MTETFERKSRRQDNQYSASVVTTLEELTHIFAIRAICFMAEHGVAVGQTYDGNDFQATHVLLRCADEPIGAVRIRWFHDFAQFDRTAIRPEHRNIRVLAKGANFAFEHVARKGFTRVVTHAAPLYAKLWEKAFGFQRTENRPALHFRGHAEELIELEKEIVPPVNAISLASRPEVIHRVEGRWDEPSDFERGDT